MSIRTFQRLQTCLLQNWPNSLRLSVDKFGTQFDWRRCRMVRQDSSTNSIASFQDNHLKTHGMKFTPGDETSCTATNNQNIDVLFRLHWAIKGVFHSPSLPPAISSQSNSSSIR